MRLNEWHKDLNLVMSNSTRDQFNDLLRSEGINAGIIPVNNIPNEESRLNEVNRLGILNRDLDQEAQYNALTQLAAIITKSQIGLINILGSNIQQCKTNFGFNVVESFYQKKCQEKFQFANTV